MNETNFVSEALEREKLSVETCKGIKNDLTESWDEIVASTQTGSMEVEENSVIESEGKSLMIHNESGYAVEYNAQDMLEGIMLGTVDDLYHPTTIDAYYPQRGPDGQVESHFRVHMPMKAAADITREAGNALGIQKYDMGRVIGSWWSQKRPVNPENASNIGRDYDLHNAANHLLKEMKELTMPEPAETVRKDCVSLRYEILNANAAPANVYEQVSGRFENRDEGYIKIDGVTSEFFEPKRLLTGIICSEYAGSPDEVWVHYPHEPVEGEIKEQTIVRMSLKQAADLAEQCAENIGITRRELVEKVGDPFRNLTQWTDFQRVNALKGCASGIKETVRKSHPEIFGPEKTE